jgi:hypothetical protein
MTAEPNGGFMATADIHELPRSPHHPSIVLGEVCKRGVRIDVPAESSTPSPCSQPYRAFLATRSFATRCRTSAPVTTRSSTVPPSSKPFPDALRRAAASLTTRAESAHLTGRAAVREAPAGRGGNGKRRVSSTWAGPGRPTGWRRTWLGPAAATSGSRDTENARKACSTAIPAAACRVYRTCEGRFRSPLRLLLTRPGA